MSHSEFWSVYRFDMIWSTCLLICMVVFLFYWEICMGCIALELAGSWVELGLSVSMVAFSRFMSINVSGGWKYSDEPK